MNARAGVLSLPLAVSGLFLGFADDALVSLLALRVCLWCRWHTVLWGVLRGRVHVGSALADTARSGSGDRLCRRHQGVSSQSASDPGSVAALLTLCGGVEWRDAP